AASSACQRPTANKSTRSGPSRIRRCEPRTRRGLVAMTVSASSRAESAVEGVTLPDADRTTAIAALTQQLAELTGEPSGSVRERARDLVWLAVRYGHHPFTTLEQARAQLGLDRAEFRSLLELFDRVPALRTAVERGPAGKYWTN